MSCMHGSLYKSPAVLALKALEPSLTLLRIKVDPWISCYTMFEQRMLWFKVRIILLLNVCNTHISADKHHTKSWPPTGMTYKSLLKA
jgi:hypothetical protein